MPMRETCDNKPAERIIDDGCGCLNPNMCDCFRGGVDRNIQADLRVLHDEDELKTGQKILA